MVNLAEVKANTLYFLAREVVERMVPPIQLVVGKSITPDNIKDRKDFRDLAQAHYNLFILGVSPDEKLDYLTELAQQLINLGSFRQARQLLNQESRKLIAELPAYGHGQSYYNAIINQKFGWIADYEGGYFDSIGLFTKSRELLGGIPLSRWGREVEGLLSTSTHFLGRGYYGLASQGIDRDGNARRALLFFEEDLERAKALRDQSQPVPANEAFQYAWLARCHFLLGDLDSAGVEIEEAGRLFDEYKVLEPKSGAKAHYHLLRGRLRLDQGLPDLAIEEFNKALRIRQEVEYYPKGYADASVGLAMAYWKKADLANSAKHAFRAVRAYPLILARGAFGG